MFKSKCPQCKGKGKIQLKTKKKCPQCKGLGSTKLIIGGGKPKSKDACPKCNGTGKIQLKKEKNCNKCKGTGSIQKMCPICNSPLSQSDNEICKTCINQESLIQLVSPVTNHSVEFNKLYLGKVVNMLDFGFFVQVAPKVEGLVRSKEFSGKINDPIVVKLVQKKGDKLEFQQIQINDYSNLKTIRKHDTLPLQKINQSREIGVYLTLLARVENIRQIPKGPKIFTLRDETGIIEAAAFGLDFVDAFSIGEIVEVSGQYTIHRGAVQIEIIDMFIADEAYSKAFIKKMDIYLDQKSEPATQNFLVESKILEDLRPKFIKVAKRLRRALLELQPIVIRHHSDCDGISAGIALEIALRQLWLATYQQEDEDKIRHVIKRTVNKPPFYDPLDAVRDVNFALEDRDRFGDKLPIVILLDTGSSEESLFSYNLLNTYDIEVMVVDHHFPSSIIQEVISTHLNVYYAGGDYNICAGMLGVELARFVNPSVTEAIQHLPAIAGTGDRVEGSEFDQYLVFAEEKGYSKNFLTDIAIAVDYQAYFLKFSPGRLLLSDLLGLKGIDEQQLSFVSLLADEAKDLLEKQLQISLEYCQEDLLPNSIRLVILDVERFTSRFDYPPPGKITGSLFDHLGMENETEPLVTVGLGPDFAIFRSKNVNLDFPRLVKILAKKLPHANIEGGGHEIVGSLKFITGAREDFIELVREQLILITVSSTTDKY